MSIPAPEPPSITSLPLPDPLAYEGEAREYARALMQRKDAIEREIEVLKDVLSSHNANASTPLVDPEGYPRSDIDVYSIRHVRSNIIRLTTDLKTVNDLLPSALESAFSRPTGSTSASSHGANGSAPSEMNGHEPIASRGSGDMPDEWPSAGIAKVNSVAPHSPAAEAGLQSQDKIYSFGGITSDTGNLQAIGALVAQSEGTAITILVSRRNERIRLRLTPRTGWGGRGLLGCHILPIS